MAKTAVAPRAKSPHAPASPKKSTAIAKPSDYSDEAYAGAGSENVGSQDMMVPRLAILQSLSPQIQKKKAEYIDGAEIGMIADLGAGEIFPDGIDFLPIFYRKDYLEWAPRSVGGLVRVHNDPNIMNECTQDSKKQWVLPSGNYIQETAQFFGFNLTAGRRPCFIPMASTQLKKARKWNTIIQAIRLPGSDKLAPMWYKTFHLATGEEGNAQGDWHGWVVAPGDTRDEWAKANKVDPAQLARDAVAFYTSLRSGAVRADTSQMAGEAGASSEGDGDAM